MNLAPAICRSALLRGLALAALATGCGQGELDEAGAEPTAGAASALTRGVNGDACTASPYNCKLRPSGGNRVATSATDDDDSWGIRAGDPIRDGDGHVLGTETASRLTFNFGQTRSFGGRVHAFAMSTSNRSAGWYPLDDILGADSFEKKVGHVSALGAGLTELGCYQVRNGSDPTLEAKKVVYDATDSHERAGDYLPLVRANGRRSANLAFNVPGFGLGGVAVDHFAAGTRFRRLQVPTDTGVPSIDIPLWIDDGHGRFIRRSGTMKFIYGFVIAATGTKRVGWMAYDALEVSSGCP
jgi:hypothetical protein